MARHVRRPSPCLPVLAERFYLMLLLKRRDLSSVRCSKRLVRLVEVSQSCIASFERLLAHGKHLHMFVARPLQSLCVRRLECIERFLVLASF